jgi:putative transposase
VATNTSIYAWALLSNHNLLNPLRVKLVKSLTQLDRYRWSGHGVWMGKMKNEWQDRGYVLRWCGQKQGEAKKAYQQLCQKGD